VTIASPRDAMAHGLGLVTQHFSLVRPMTVTENVVLSEAGLGPVDLRAARGRVLEAADLLGVTVDPDARVADLSVGEQQRVEILKALFRKCRVLVLDEPTAVLVPQDAEALFASVRRLTAAGLAVLFISHKLHEVTAVSTRVSVLRRGRIVDTVPAAGASPRELAELMVGRPTLGVRRADAPVADADLAVASTSGVAAGASAVAAGPGTAVLEVDGLVVAGRGERPAVDGVSLVVRGGEILGIAGVSGNGQSELVAALCGMRSPAAGSARVAGVDITGASPTAVMAAGLGRIPEDRHGSVVGALTVEDNLVLEDLAPYRRGPFLDRRRIRRHARSSSSATPSRPSRPTRCRRCPAATCRRCCWRGCCPATRARWSSRSRPAAGRRCHRVRPPRAAGSARPRHGGAAGVRGPGGAARPLRPRRRDVRGTDRRARCRPGRRPARSSGC
jgi:simple sugar transport system ATP-binding protein